MSRSLTVSRFHRINCCQKVKISIICLGIVFGSFAKPLPGNTSSSNLKSPQYLPLEAQWCIPNKDCFLLEIADTDLEKKIGLMHRRTLGKGTGMWFKFVPPEIVRFWMLDTFLPLDIIFIYKGIVVAIEANAEICLLDICPTFGPDLQVDSVIEIAAGEVARLNLKAGDSIIINYLNK